MTAKHVEEIFLIEIDKIKIAEKMSVSSFTKKKYFIRNVCKYASI